MAWTEPQFWEAHRVIRNSLSPKQIDDEWVYFQEYARRFPDNEPEGRYGILAMGEKPSWGNMIYSDCVKTLHYMHLIHVVKTGGSQIHRFVKFLNKLEVLEGKKILV